MSKPESAATVRISELTKDEIAAADALVNLYELLGKLGPSSRQKVYQRWGMLRLIRYWDDKRWESEVKRVTGK